jgi:hypothetical protein
MDAEVGAFWEVLAQQSIGILVGASLPRALRIAKVNLKASVDFQARMLSHFCALIPSQRSSKLLRQSGDRAGDGLADCASSVAGERPLESDVRLIYAVKTKIEAALAAPPQT